MKAQVIEGDYRRTRRGHILGEWGPTKSRCLPTSSNKQLLNGGV